MPSTQLSPNVQNTTWAENRHSEQHVTQVRKRARTWFNSPSDILMKVMCWGQDRFKQCSLVCGQFANREEDLLLNGHLCDFLAPSAASSSCQTTLQCMASCEDPRRFIDFDQNLIEATNPNAFLKTHVEEGFLQNNEKQTGDARSH